MNLVQPFLDSIQENPEEPGLWMILADWLEDQGDPRAELVRLTQNLHTEPEHPDFANRQDRLQTLIRGGMLPLVPKLVNSIGMELALIPAGTFWQGSPARELGRFDDESPYRPVTITRPFHLGIYPVTQAEYLAVLGENPSTFDSTNKGGPSHPVEAVTWFDAIRFCEVLSQLPAERKAGRVYRLPTEAEWEFACRAGTTSPFHFGQFASSAQANFDGNHSYNGAAKGPYLQRTTSVGLYLPNARGLHDMHGNVREWCNDWYDPLYYHENLAVDPPGPAFGDGRVQRGGSWGSFSWGCRSAFRLSIEPEITNSVGGFRVLTRLEL